MNFVDSILAQTIIFAVPIIISALGGLLAYKINIVNIGLEGFMVFSALVSTVVMYFTGSYMWGLLSAIAISAIMGLIYAFFAVTQKLTLLLRGLR